MYVHSVLCHSCTARGKDQSLTAHEEEAPESRVEAQDGREGKSSVTKSPKPLQARPAYPSMPEEGEAAPKSSRKRKGMCFKSSHFVLAQCDMSRPLFKNAICPMLDDDVKIVSKKFSTAMRTYCRDSRFQSPAALSWSVGGGGVLLDVLVRGDLKDVCSLSSLPFMYSQGKRPVSDGPRGGGSGESSGGPGR